MRLLFAEDDRALCRAEKTILENAGYSVDFVHNGEDALDYAQAAEYDGIILDWMMPAPDGVEVLRRLREGGIATPCLLLTARDAVEDRVAGLDAGADDYLPKPFASAELLARIRAMLRRKADYKPDLLKYGDLTLDRQEMNLAREKKTVRLSNKMYQLMEMLMEQPGRIFEVNQIIERIWGWDCESDTNVIWVTVFNLRKVLKDLGTTVTIRVTRPRTTAPARRSSAPSSSRSHRRTHTHTPAGPARRSPAQAPQPPHRRPYHQHRQQASPPQAQQPHTAATSHQQHQTPEIQHKRARAHDAAPTRPRNSKRARA